MAHILPDPDIARKKSARVDHGLVGEGRIKTENDMAHVMAAKQLGAFFGQIPGTENPAGISGIILRKSLGENHVRVLVPAGRSGVLGRWLTLSYQSGEASS